MKTLINFNGKTPKIHPTCRIAPNAVVSGDVIIDENSSVWFHVVIRGDVNQIRIGKNTNIQDLSIIHGTTGKKATLIGDNVSIGHRAIIHGCEIMSNTLIGMGAIILDDAVIEENTIIAAGAVVTQGMRCESGHIYAGIPARPVKALTKDKLDFYIHGTAEGYVYLSDMYAEFKEYK